MSYPQVGDDGFGSKSFAVVYWKHLVITHIFRFNLLLESRTHINAYHLSSVLQHACSWLTPGFFLFQAL